MSRGRKPIEIVSSDWEKVFYDSVGTYVQYINLHLSEQFKSEPLSKHIRIAGGYAFKSSEYKKSGIPVIRISDFSNEQITLKDVVYYTESKELERYELKEGDIVIALTGGTIAKLGIVQKGIGKLYLNQRVGKFEVLNPNEFENEYVYWIARSVQSIIKNLAWGAAIPNVSPKQIEELEFPIPDKKTQRGIIDFLNALRLDEVGQKVFFNQEIESQIYSLQRGQIIGTTLKTELTHQQDLLSQLRQSFLREAMQGKLVKQDPKDGNAKDLVEKIKAEKVKSGKKEKELPPIKPEEIPFEIPENWVWCRLGEICTIKGGKRVPNGYKLLKTPTPHIYIRVSDMKNGTISENDLHYIDEEVYQRIKQYTISKDDIYMTIVGGTIGKCGLVPEKFHDMNLTENAAKIIPTLVNKYFLWLCLDSPFCQSQFIDKTKQVGVQKMALNRFSSSLIALPPLSEQTRIVEKLNELMSLCDGLQDSIQAGRGQNELLLQQVLKEALMN